MLQSMRTWWLVVGVLGSGLAGVACGSSGKGTPSSGGEASGGSLSGSAGSQAGLGATGTAGGAGGTTTGGDGELDASCRERTTSHIAGSRIGLRSITTTEGDEAFRGYYDVQLGHDCQFITDAEGVVRCFPIATTSDDPFFLDASCSQTIRYKGICGHDFFVEPVSDDSCDQRRRVFALGEPIADTMVYERNSAGECVSYGTLNRLYERGAELSPADYPAVTAVEWRGKGRVWSHGFEGEGGLRAVRGYLDSELQEACSFRLLPGGQESCAPSQLGSLTLSNATCDAVLVTGRAVCDGPAARYAVAASADVCDPAQPYVQAGEAYTGPLHTRGQCLPAPAAQTEGLQAFVGALAPATTFMQVQTSINQDDPGRLKPTYRTSADGGCWFSGWWDEQLQTACEFQVGTDDAVYCLPPATANLGGTLLEGFSDEQCTTSARYLRVPACNAEKVPGFATLEAQQTCTLPRYTVHQVAASGVAADAVGPLFTLQNEVCTEHVKVATELYFAVTEPLDLSMFMSAE
jgi:hypothetical protein